MTQNLWPAQKIEMRPRASLRAFAQNSRTHSPEQVEQLARSIEQWGWTVPVLIDPTGEVIAGHGRLDAAERLGIEDVPCMIAEGWSEAQKRAYVIADNKLAENAGWDQDLLASETAWLQSEGFETDLLGFSDAELAKILIDATEGLTDPDDTPEPPARPVSALGDVWILGRHRITCGSSTEAETVARVLAGVRPHLMVTDPPYGVEYDASFRNKAAAAQGKKQSNLAVGKVLNDDRADWSEAWALFPGDVAYVWHAGLFAGIVADSLTANGFKVRSQIIWAKSSLTMGRGDYHWQHEPCWYAVREGKTGHYAGDRKQTTLWQIPKPAKSETGHSTQKPVECMKRPIENNSSPGQAIYEPFSGSGTTIIAAEMTGRSCYAIELNPPYVDVAVTRWQAFTGLVATLEGDGRSFAEVASERVPA